MLRVERTKVSRRITAKRVQPPRVKRGTASRASLDPLLDTEVRSQFLLLGEVSPILGGATVFIAEEALHVRRLRVTFTSAPSSIDALLLYDHDRRPLGRASLDAAEGSGRVYALDIASGKLEIPRRQEWKFYARAIMKSYDRGGVSGEVIRISSMGVTGEGVWSNASYTKSSTETFLLFQTARSILTEVQSVGERESALVSGTRRSIGTFEITGKRGAGSPDLRVTSLSLQVEEAGGVTLSNVVFRREGVSTDHICSVSSGRIACSSLSEDVGSLKGAPLRFTILADVTLPQGAQEPLLRLTISDPGSVTSAGDITWTDGETSFSWVPFAQPVATGTLFR